MGCLLSPDVYEHTPGFGVIDLTLIFPSNLSRSIAPRGPARVGCMKKMNGENSIDRVSRMKATQDVLPALPAE